jgi:hypothetical protein
LGEDGKAIVKKLREWAGELAKVAGLKRKRTHFLQKSNRMEIESLLNPAGESHVLTESSDTEIIAVIDAIDARANIEINGGDDDDIPPEPRPTRHDVLKAASTIGRYIDDMNEPIARKLEALLGSFNRQLRLDETRSMKSTVLTDFFGRVV